MRTLLRRIPNPSAVFSTINTIISHDYHLQFENMGQTVEGVETGLMDARQQLQHAETSMDIFWLLYGSVLIFLMQIGFTFMTVGVVSSKNTKTVLLMNVIDM